MKKIIYFGLAVSLVLTACDKEPKITVKPIEGDVMTLEGGEGGASAVNSVYVDFSKAEQVSVARASWDLAFHCGSEFGVRLNNTIGARASEAPAGIKLTTVLTEEEFETYKSELNPSMGNGTFDTADDIDSDTNFAGTIIKKDKIYLCYQVEGDGQLYKVSVAEKNGNTYTVTYSLWNSAETKTLDIAKDTDYNFIAMSFEKNATVNHQPKKDDWDIVWGRNTYISAMAEGVPFVMADIVFLNTKSGVKAQSVMIEEHGEYDDFTAEKAAGLTLSSDIGVIGSFWRNGGGPTSGPSVKTDRFYVVKDVQGNLYKLGFISMNDGTDGGRRGYPEIKFDLLAEAQ